MILKPRSNAVNDADDRRCQDQPGRGTAEGDGAQLEESERDFPQADAPGTAIGRQRPPRYRLVAGSALRR